MYASQLKRVCWNRYFLKNTTLLSLNSFKESAFFVLSLKIKTNQLNFVIGCKAYLDALWDTVNWPSNPVSYLATSHQNSCNDHGIKHFGSAIATSYSFGIRTAISLARMSSSVKATVQKAEDKDQLARPQLAIKRSKGVSQSCAAEVRNTLPAAFTLAEVVTDPGFYLIKASHTRDEYDCWDVEESANLEQRGYSINMKWKELP